MLTSSYHLSHYLKKVVNVSPTEESYFESLCSLRFASQVNQCELGKPKRHVRDAGALSQASDPVSPQNSNHRVKSSCSSSSSDVRPAGSAASGASSGLKRKAVTKARDGSKL